MAYDKKIIDFVGNNKTLLTPREIIAVEELDNYLFKNKRKVKAIIPQIEYIKLNGVNQRIMTPNDDIAYLVKEIIYAENALTNQTPPTTVLMRYERYAPRDGVQFDKYPEYSYFLGGQTPVSYQLSMQDTNWFLADVYANGTGDTIETNKKAIANIAASGGGGLTSTIFTRKTLINDIVLCIPVAAGGLFTNSIAFCFNFLIENM